MVAKDVAWFKLIFTVIVPIVVTAVSLICAVAERQEAKAMSKQV
jgi:hypothetical protein